MPERQQRSSAEDGAAAPDPSVPLWAPPARARRGPTPKYSLEAIAEAAIAIADEEGLPAVAMQRVAERLGTTKMALYRYVPGRAELDAVILDRALGVPEGEMGADWRTSLAAWADGIHCRALAHPWCVELAQRPHVPGPGELAWIEAGLEAVSGLPLRGSEKLDLLVLLTGHVLSNVRQFALSGAPEDALSAGLAPIFAAHAGAYPRAATAFAQSAKSGGRDDALRFGIERVLAGVSALVDERAASA